VFFMTAGDMLSELNLRGQRVPLGHGLTGLAAHSRQTQVGVPTYHSVQQAEHHKLESPQYLIAAPMLVGKRLAGVLTAATYNPEKQFSAEEVRLFERIAILAGVVLTRREEASLF
jgi:GAF domain-containing protein